MTLYLLKWGNVINVLFLVEVELEKEQIGQYSCQVTNSVGQGPECHWEVQYSRGGEIVQAPAQTYLILSERAILPQLTVTVLTVCLISSLSLALVILLICCSWRKANKKRKVNRDN